MSVSQSTPHPSSPRRRTIVVVLAALVTAAVVVSPGLGRTTAMPSVSFIHPKQGATVGSTVTFTVELTDFRLAPKQVGKAKRANQGHLHFQMDGGKYDYARYSGPNGALAAKLGIAGKYSPSVTPSITYKHLPAGTHTLVVFLANNDHSPVGPKASVSFTVR